MLAALTTILDTSALAMVRIDGTPVQQAQHTVVDLSQIFNKPPLPPEIDRLSKDDLMRVLELLAEAGVALHSGDDADQQLLQLRESYEPYMNALSQFLLIALPPWYVNATRSDNWQTSAWERSSLRLRTQQDSDDHF